MKEMRLFRALFKAVIGCAGILVSQAYAQQGEGDGVFGMHQSGNCTVFTWNGVDVEASKGMQLATDSTCGEYQTPGFSYRAHLSADGKTIIYSDNKGHHFVYGPGEIGLDGHMTLRRLAARK